MATPHIDAMLATAEYFIGLKESGNNTFKDPRGAEMKALAGFPGYSDAWCACFVSACTAGAGIAGILVPRSCSTSEILVGSAAMGAQIILGPKNNGGAPVTPERGDIITFSNSNTWKGATKGTHIGIVEFVDNRVHTIEGNSSNQCKKNDYALSDTYINAYIRPDWARVGDIVGEPEPAQVSIGPLYESRNDRHDMTLRQVGYLDGGYNLTNSSGSGITVSIINYTTVLGDLYDTFAPASIGGLQIDTSQITGNDKSVMDYLVGLGFSESSACGVAGCLYVYSGINTQYVGNVGNEYMYGIGAWNSSKLSVLKSRAGSGWATDLSGQLEYLVYDLYINHKALLASIKTQALNKAGANRVIDLLMAKYNSHYSDSASIKSAKDHAAEMFDKIVILGQQIVGDTKQYTDINGHVLAVQRSVEVPLDIQSGLLYDSDYTSYTHWYYKWASGSYQKALSRVWSDQGKACDKGIATIGGYYCVAVKPIFGGVGDVIEVTLEDNTTFGAIIADQKGDDADSPWGHPKSGGISVIEWERIKTSVGGGVITAKIGPTNVDKNTSIGDWAGQKILRIANYGKYVVL